MIFLYSLFIIVFIYALFFKTKRHVHMLQQNLYNENNRYLKWVFKNESFLSLDLFVIVVLLIGMIIKNLNIISNLCMLLTILLLLIIGFEWYKLIKNDQNKKKLVITARVKRLLFSIVILYLLPVLFLYRYDGYYNWILLLVEVVLLYLNNIVIFVAMIINTPIERLVYLYYKSKAMNKLNSMNNLKIVGITGSYGKTSCKRILATILNYKYNALPTPKNLNTFNGLIMTINNYMDKFCDIFIAEMGAYVKGEIKRLCKLVKPKYGIITTIGTAHLESFGSQENIQHGKFELIESLPIDGFGVLNGDDPLQVNYKIKNNVRIIWIGIENKEVDVRAENIKCSGMGTSFDVVLKGKKEKTHFETKLLGNHNVYNILSAIACGLEFGLDMDDLVKAVKTVKPIEHRLEIKKLGNFYQIDDAYNSNPIGAKNACKILSMMPGYRIAVTPGMIELGDKEDYENEVLGEELADSCDEVILIGEKKTKPIKKGLLAKGFDKEKIIVFNDVRDAFPYIGNIANEKVVYALFENDLPDTFNEK